MRMARARKPVSSEARHKKLIIEVHDRVDPTRHPRRLDETWCCYRHDQQCIGRYHSETVAAAMDGLVDETRPSVQHAAARGVR